MSHSMSHHDVIAAFDFGSNSIKMTVARRSGTDHFDEIKSMTETTRLGQDLDKAGRIAEERIAASTDALYRMTTQATALGATRFVGVATEAVRVSTNGPAFLDQVRKEFGIEVVSITGDQEAALTYQGVARYTDLRGEVIIADIGGGSTEILVVKNLKIEFSRSLPLGSGRLADRFYQADPPSMEAVEACQRAAADILAGLPIEPNPRARLLAVGGTGELVLALAARGSVIHQGDLAQVRERLTRVPAKELATALGIAESRAKMLPAGEAIIAALAERLTPMQIEASRSGLRAGLLMAAFSGTV